VRHYIAATPYFFIEMIYGFGGIYSIMWPALKRDPLIDHFCKEGKMEKKYLKKMLTGLSIASLVTGIGGFALGASG
jgi:radical SAM modification target selenobiotic family peptide